MEKNKTLLTSQGYQELKDELDNLINVKRPENIKAIKDARSLGDLSENAEYDAARNEQAEIEGRIKQLEKLLENSYAPISHFGVSSIIITKDGSYFSGVNVEDASTRAGTCAERNALFSMITAGYKPGDVKEINIMLSSGEIGTPCFVCRQMISELCNTDTKINCYAKDGRIKTFTVEELCPYPFTEEDLK